MGDVSGPGFIVGLPSEARLLRHAFGRQSLLVFCSGAKPHLVAAGVAELRRQGANCLVSWGLAGGLDPSLEAGDVVLGSAIATVDGTRLAIDQTISMSLESALGDSAVDVRQGVIAGIDRIASTPNRKRAIAAATGAIAADMESHALAEAAGGCPVAVLRVVVDSANRTIPGSVLEALDGNANVQAMQLLAGLARRPGEMFGLIGLAVDHGKARRKLRRTAAVMAKLFEAG